MRKRHESPFYSTTEKKAYKASSSNMRHIDSCSLHKNIPYEKKFSSNYLHTTGKNTYIDDTKVTTSNFNPLHRAHIMSSSSPSHNFIKEVTVQEPIYVNEIQRDVSYSPKYSPLRRGTEEENIEIEYKHKFSPGVT